jgi:hypothetical protein
MEHLQQTPPAAETPPGPLELAQTRVQALYDHIAARRAQETQNGAGRTLDEIRQRLGYVTVPLPE